MITKRPHIELDEERHIYYVDGIEYPSVSEILEPLTAPHYKSISAETLRLASERGRSVHESCEEIDYGLEAEVPPEYEPYVRAYLDFKRDYNPEYLGIEMALAYKDAFDGNNFAGTIDRYGIVDGKRWIIDLKTTASPTKINYLAYCIQTRMYEMLIEDNRKEEVLDKSEWENPKRKILFLKKDGKYRLFDCEEWEQKNGIDTWKIISKLLYLNKVTRPLVKGEKK